MAKLALFPVRRFSALSKLLLLLLWVLVAVVFVFSFTVAWLEKTGIHSIVLAETILERHAPALRFAVVIPFTARDAAGLAASIASTWRAQVPCAPARGYAALVDLVFYFNADVVGTGTGFDMTADGVSLVRVLSDAVAADPRVAQCFASVRFVNALLAEADDAYPRGPSKMFFKLFATLRKHPLLHDARSTALSKKDIRMHHQAIFYMEPDNYPCRAFWLDRLYEEASIPGDFWMRGSILRDGNPTVADYTFSEHINGNALYRVDDSAFLEFLSRVSMEMDADTDGKRYLHSYDVAIDLVRRNRTLFDWLEFTKTASKFQFTETIQNWYRTRVNATQLCQENDATYLVHGREVLF